MALTDWEMVIGLEVHAQLLTRTKLFCGCSTAFGGEPNSRTCPVCLGMPGVLPVLNAQAVTFAIRAGLATACEIRRESVFARKNYFYPDLPKGYQITQFDKPVCERGRLVFDHEGAETAIGITRIHIEEDAGKSTHDPAGGPSRIDLNRAGVPLLEIVSEPELRGADEAAAYLKSLRDVLVYLEVNDGNLEEGSFRCDANVSVRRRGEAALRARVELKNLNSFRFVKQAIEHEFVRQVELWERGEAVVTETRLYDSEKNVTRAMRSKEEAHDYRYFPDPDLLPLRIDEAEIERARSALPELPRQKLRRFVETLGLSAYDASVLVADRHVAAFFDATQEVYGGAAKTVANWIINELLRLTKDAPGGVRGSKVTPEKLAALLRLLDERTIGASAAKQVLEELHRTGAEPAHLVEERGLAQQQDPVALDAAIERILAAHPVEVEQYKAGKTKLLGFFMGRLRKELQGNADPRAITEALTARLAR